MKSTLFSERHRRYLEHSWSQRQHKLDKKVANRHAHLKSRIKQSEERVMKNGELIKRLRHCMLGDIDALLLDESEDGDHLAGRGNTANGPGSAGSTENPQESPAQTTRLFTQTVLVLDVL